MCSSGDFKSTSHALIAALNSVSKVSKSVKKKREASSMMSCPLRLLLDSKLFPDSFVFLCCAFSKQNKTYTTTTVSVPILLLSIQNRILQRRCSSRSVPLLKIHPWQQHVLPFCNFEKRETHVNNNSDVQDTLVFHPEHSLLCYMFFLPLCLLQKWTASSSCVPCVKFSKIKIQMLRAYDCRRRDAPELDCFLKHW